MAELEWMARDARDLVRRDRIRAVREASPWIVASGLMALWLRTTAPMLAAVFLGMFLAWVVSVASTTYSLRSRWRVLQVGPLRVELGEKGLTWVSSHGTRTLLWDRLEVRRLGATWIFLVKGHEAAFLPDRCLDDDERHLLGSRLEKGQGMRTIACSLLVSTFLLAPPQSGSAAEPEHPDGSPHQQIFYNNGPLRLEGYLYKPTGDGPFPIVIYNHGSREGEERSERPFPFIGRLLTAAGYAVLVPERRGYGKSDGRLFREEVGSDLGARFIGRLQAESDDVLAALDYLKTVPGVDASRVGIMGWSFGGIVSVFAASRGDHFFAVVDQAGGSLTWSRSRELQSALPEAARKIRAPILCMAAENDATTASVKSVCEAARSHGSAAMLTIYPPFAPQPPGSNIAPGHLLFSVQGVSHWGSDVVAFLDKHRPR